MLRHDLTLTNRDLISSGHFRGGAIHRPTAFLLRDVCDVGAGLEIDRYSLPWLLRRFQPKGIRHIGPSVRHDDGLIRATGTRRAIDKRLSADMKVVGIEWLYRLPTYTGVRIGSWGGYRRPEPENIKYMALMSDAPDVRDWQAYRVWMDKTRSFREAWAANRIAERRAASPAGAHMKYSDNIEGWRELAEEESSEWLFKARRAKA